MFNPPSFQARWLNFLLSVELKVQEMLPIVSAMIDRCDPLAKAGYFLAELNSDVYRYLDWFL